MKICIIGGGTTGWWTAGYLEKKFPEFDITLIESDTIPIIGVGESTLPQISNFFKEMGMDDAEWMKAANGQYKYGNIKSNWKVQGDQPFAFTFWQNDGDRFSKWKEKYLAGGISKDSLNNEYYRKNEWNAIAYHLDAEKAGIVIKNRCKRVTHIIDTLEELPTGYDLYIDCTGFRRKFVKDHTEIKLEHHLTNRAWVCPFELQKSDIRNYTQSIARSAGWQFIIDLSNRIGTGYVFSSEHQTEEDALAEFKKVNEHRTPFMNKEPRLIKWNPGYLANPWSENVVAIGLSNGFIDPLESNALFLTQYSITTLAHCLEKNTKPEVYNRSMRKVWRDNSTYIKCHYMLTERDDTSFWKYYKKFNVETEIWKNYHRMGNKYTNLYSDAIWAMLGVYFDRLSLHTPK